MEHTWQTDHLPKLEVANLESGDVAVCGSFARRAAMLSELDADRVAFVAPLDSRSDLEWLLRGLRLHPSIRQLVICGDDQRATGEALLALWEGGLDEAASFPALEEACLPGWTRRRWTRFATTSGSRTCEGSR